MYLIVNRREASEDFRQVVEVAALLSQNPPYYKLKMSMALPWLDDFSDVLQ